VGREIQTIKHVNKPLESILNITSYCP